MSCGDPHETNCKDVLDRVYLFLDNEIDLSWRQRICVHLDECGPCLRQFGIEREVKALVHRHCGGESAPPSLRDSVLVRIQQIRVQLADG